MQYVMYIIAYNIHRVNIYISYFLIKIVRYTAAAGRGSAALPLKKVYKPPALSQQTFTAYSRTFAGSAAIFHVLLTPGWGLYFFFSPAGAKPANRFGGDLKVYF